MRMFRITLMMGLLGACTGGMSPSERQVYEKTINDWHIQRVADLKKEDGWLNLSGLFWLSDGLNSFGADGTLQVVFPEKFPLAKAGFFLLQNGIVTMVTPEANGILVSGKPGGAVVLFHPDSSSVIVASKGDFRWNIIKRQDKYGVRLRDLASTAVEGFTGPERFPVDPDFRVEGRLVTTDTLRTILISNALGQTVPERSPGWVEFKLKGRPYSLDALESGDELFFVFADATTGAETYGGGRFLYAARPGPDGLVELDFNKAIDPPCVFTPYATCPLPPEQNRLPIAVRAGEKDFHH